MPPRSETSWCGQETCVTVDSGGSTHRSNQGGMVGIREFLLRSVGADGRDEVVGHVGELKLGWCRKVQELRHSHSLAQVRLKTKSWGEK